MAGHHIDLLVAWRMSIARTTHSALTLVLKSQYPALINNLPWFMTTFLPSSWALLATPSNAFCKSPVFTVGSSCHLHIPGLRSLKAVAASTIYLQTLFALCLTRLCLSKTELLSIISTGQPLSDNDPYY